ncbi:MAG TPA: tetratricopeptide repeat protein [Tepidisphaeraceae bacterium]|nr:tetratricopeptide repeat protein [Tepidisphaeraceae bacterium]
MPDTPEFHRAQCIELRQQGKLNEAMKHIKRALELRPDYPAGYYNMAAIFMSMGRADQAAVAWRKAIELKPEYYQAWSSLSAALRRLGRHQEAVDAAAKAVGFKPDDPDALLNMASSLCGVRRFDEAAVQFEQLLRLHPNHVAGHNNYGNLLADMDRPTRAAEQYKAAIALDPNMVEIVNNLGNVYKSAGQIREAIDCFREVLAKRPRSPHLHGNLLLTLNCTIQADTGLLAEHRDWATKHADPLLPAKIEFPNSRDPDRKLRIGYVSADFRRHSVAYFIEPVIRAHHRQNVEVFLYGNILQPDDITRRIAGMAKQWRSIAGVDDARVAQTIRQDQVDILVDLSGHTANNRLLLFARKPAPIQITYLGYPNTTGMKAMDYRLTDGQADPPGLTESHHTEKLLRLPQCFLCFRPADNAPPPRQLGRDDPSTIIFGSFNNFAKVSPQTLSLWANVLAAVPNSRLLLKAECLGESTVQQALRSDFAAYGVDPARIDTLGREPSFLKHLETYHRIDIGLDTFPYHGTTTTCEALWMGVPVVTLAGHAHVSRVGVSLLNAIGLPELIARHPDEFTTIAAELARDHARRRRISSVQLREQIRSSVLMDSKSFVAGLEEIYRKVWRDWCNQSAAL